jgi:thioredoxin 1
MIFMAKPVQLLFLLIALVSAGSVTALDYEPFTQERFVQLQDSGANILVDIGASWCPDCQKQKAALGKYQELNPESGLHILMVDFDTQKEWVTHFRAPRQSTLILFSGTEQVWFSVAETREDQIFAALNSL